MGIFFSAVADKNRYKCNDDKNAGLCWNTATKKDNCSLEGINRNILHKILKLIILFYMFSQEIHLKSLNNAAKRMMMM